MRIAARLLAAALLLPGCTLLLDPDDFPRPQDAGSLEPDGADAGQHASGFVLVDGGCRLVDQPATNSRVCKPDGGMTTSCPLPEFSQPPHPGDLIVVVASWFYRGDTQAAVTDQADNRYSALGAPVEGPGMLAAYRSQLFYAWNTGTTAVGAIACTLQDPTTDIQVIAHDYSGVNPTAPPVYAFGIATGADSSMELSLEAAPALVFGGGLFYTAQNLQAGPGFTPRVATSGDLTEDACVVSPGAHTVSFKHDPAASSILAAGFKLY